MALAVIQYPHMMGDDDGPLAADHYKRAVHRPAPNRFAIEFLPPAKVGGSYSYGMRVSPISRGDRSSISSNGSNFEYDVWRRWEDCLWFQDGLELEYKRSARQKRQRLLQGKGVKKNGFYLQDQASSWESLPPGPDPNSVALDIHGHIPKLTKRGTIFRANMATIEQRNAELQAFVEALFKEDQPALIKEMRSTRLVTDFFGYWHRDVELASKKQKSKARESRESLTPSVFSSYFSTSSTPSLPDIPNNKSPKSQPNSPLKRPFLRARAFTTSSERPHSIASSQLTEVPASTITGGRTSSDTFMSSSASSVTTVRRRAISVTSSSGSSSSQDDHSDTVSAISNPRIAEEVSISFGHNPQQHTSPQPRPASMLDALPEESDDVATPLTPQDFIRKKTNGLNQRRNRNGQIFISPPDTSSSTSFDSPQPRSDVVSPSKCGTTSTGIKGTHSALDNDRSLRDSWATIDSTSTYLEGLHIGLPSGCRHSMASINTFMTTDSAEAVLPRSPLPLDSQDKSRANPRASVPVSLSDFDMYPEILEDDEIDSIYDAFPRPASLILERPEIPIPHDVSPRLNTSDPYLPGPPSPTASVSTTFSSFSVSTTASMSTIVTSSTSSSGDGNKLSIKAALNDSIIMFRASRDIELSELRQRLFNKFVEQEGIPLSKDFMLAVVVTQANSPIAQLRKPAAGTRKRSSSVTSVDNPEVRIVDSQGDWETVAYLTEGTKLTLRVLNTPA